MLNVRKQDPLFTNFMPRNAEEAVDRYVRCRRNGLKQMLIPECLIACARGLRGIELDKFENWIINPGGDLSRFKLVPSTEINTMTDALHAAAADRVELELATTPPLPVEASTDEKIEELEALTVRLAPLESVSESLSPLSSGPCEQPAK